MRLFIHETGFLSYRPSSFHIDHENYRSLWQKRPIKETILYKRDL